VTRATRTSEDVALGDAVAVVKKRVEEEQLLDSDLLVASS